MEKQFQKFCLQFWVKFLKPSLYFTLLAVFFSFNSAHADNIRHTYGGDGVSGDPLNSFYIDERGGDPSSNPENITYLQNHQDIDLDGLGFGPLLYTDTEAGAIVAEGFPGNNFTNPSPINIFDLTLLPETTGAAGEVGLANILPVLPAFYEGVLPIEQVSFTSYAPNALWVGIEYTIVNTTGMPITTAIALARNADAWYDTIDASAGILNIPPGSDEIPIVYVREDIPYAPVDNSLAAISIVGTDASNVIYRIEECNLGDYNDCPIFELGDATRVSFFEDPLAQGDQTGGALTLDYALVLGTEPQELPPGGRLTTVFCLPIGEGTVNLVSRAEDCQQFYEDEIQNCGNFLTNLGEQCDDGDANDQNDCLNNCELPICGDGVTWNQGTGNEECDDGNEVTTDACPSGPDGTCQDAECGDGFVWAGVEECDDGNEVDTDDCPTTCNDAGCGDGFVWAGVEGCDDGDGDNTDDCPDGASGTCEPAECGDGFVWAGVEECDLGAGNSDSDSDTCRTNCMNPSCGDDVLDSGEACDEGDANSDSGACLSNCEIASCGDGFIHAGVEVCDTGIPGYGADCQANCTVFDSCGNGVLDNPLEECDDGNANNNDSCPNTCQDAECGDGYTLTGVEECDDGNLIPGDGCSATCQTEPGFSVGEPVSSANPICGDGNVDAEIGETCDDGNTEDLDGCSSQCLFEPVLQGSGTPGGEGGGCSLRTAENALSAKSLALFLLPALLLVLWRRQQKELP